MFFLKLLVLQDKVWGEFFRQSQGVKSMAEELCETGSDVCIPPCLVLVEQSLYLIIIRERLISNEHQAPQADLTIWILGNSMTICGYDGQCQITRTQVLELGPRDWSLPCPGLVWWCADDALMMHWWCADDAWVSYLISLNPKLFKDIAHVGSFENCLCLCLCLCICLCLRFEVDSGCHGQGHLSL